jgi:glutamate synthase (NADPH/NADH) large chain
MYLEGDANDYVGKGMTGGKLNRAAERQRSKLRKAPSSVTPACTARPAASCSQLARQASVSPCVTPVLTPLWKARAITAVST